MCTKGSTPARVEFSPACPEITHESPPSRPFSELGCSDGGLMEGDTLPGSLGNERRAKSVTKKGNPLSIDGYDGFLSFQQTEPWRTPHWGLLSGVMRKAPRVLLMGSGHAPQVMDGEWGTTDRLLD